LQKFGRIDVLVNNAGVTRDGLAVRMKREDWDRVLQINLSGAFFAIQQVLPAMMKQRWGASSTSHRLWARAAMRARRITWRPRPV
jgi:NAD(P)-dependent dehydrogenase (short-subunit alcohol dehydrogenase family)